MSAERAGGGGWPNPLVGATPVAGVRVPDSRAAREAESACREAAGWVLYAHSARSYVFAALLGARERARFDEEALYVGCLLHDIGLTPGHADPVRAFEHVSADYASDFTSGLAWPHERTANVHRAIVLHMAREISASEAVEVRLLEAGVACDVTGRGWDALDPGAQEAVFQRLPRGPFKSEFSSLMQSEATAKPHCAAADLLDAGLVELIERAPHQDTADPTG